VFFGQKVHHIKPDVVSGIVVFKTNISKASDEKLHGVKIKKGSAIGYPFVILLFF